MFGLFKKKLFKLLIVEDNLQTQETLKLMFETQVMEITIAGDAESALKRMHGGYIPDIIVLDLRLPGASGGEFIKALNSNPKFTGIKVVPFSSTINEVTEQAYAQAKPIVDEYLQARHLVEKAGNISVADIIPKYKGREGVDIVHPQLIAAVAQVLIARGVELSSSFQHLLAISRKQIERMEQQKKK